ncbi:hypothetical protein GCM10028864_38250 [Microlunatus parietis]
MAIQQFRAIHRHSVGPESPCWQGFPAYDPIMLTLGLAILIYCVARAVIEGRSDPPLARSD